MRLRTIPIQLLATVFILALASGYALAGSVTLRWTLPTMYEDGTPLDEPLGGAKIYWGMESSNYMHIVDAGLTNSCTVTGLTPGTTYYFNGTAYSRAGLESEFTVEVAKVALDETSTNLPPQVDAGEDAQVILPTMPLLQGSVSDDGYPLPSNLTVEWRKTSGPGTVAFNDASAVATHVSFSREGDYILTLSVSDGAITASDEVAVAAESILRAPSGVFVRR